MLEGGLADMGLGLKVDGALVYGHKVIFVARRAGLIDLRVHTVVYRH